MDGQNRSQIIDEMIVALRADIAYLEQEGGSQILIKNGKFLAQEGEQFLYQFELDLFQGVDENAEIEIRIGKDTTQGKIYSLDEKSIQLALENYLGSSIYEARLIISNSYLLKILCEKLEEAKNTNKQISQLSELVLDPSKAIISSINSYEKVGKQIPNSSQENAIKLALGSQVSFIWGPPGTGKTSVIVPIIKNLIDQNKNILLISHTNLATNRALRAFLNVMCEHAGDELPEELLKEEHFGKYLRIGSNFSELEKYQNYIDIRKIAEEKVKPLIKELEKINSEIDKLDKEITNLQILLDKINKLNNLKIDLQNKKHDASKNTEQYNDTKIEIENLEVRLKKINLAIEEYQSSGTLKRLFSGISLGNLTSNKTNIITELDIKQKENNISESRIERDKNQIEELDNVIKGLKEETEGKNTNDLNSQLETINKDSKNLKEQRDALQKNINEIQESVVIEAKLIATTLSNCYVNKSVLNRSYDCVIIDEASMAPIPALFYAAGLAKEKVIVVGDFCQLPPIAKHRILYSDLRTQEVKDLETTLVTKWLKDDIYTFSRTKEMLRTGELVPWLRQLNIQYRMDPDIGDVVNHIMYEQFPKTFWLQHGDNTKNRRDEVRENLIIHSEPLTGSSIGIYETDKKTSFPYRTKSGSYYNLYQALLSVHIAEEAIKNCNQNSQKPISIGIITPFRPQANLIQKIVEDRGLEKQVQSDTVHRFQGEEKDIIIFDLVTSQPTHLTDDGSPEGDDEKLLNVAFSRAKLKCILVADISTALQKHSQSSAIRKFIEYCVKKEFPIIKANTIFSGFTTMEEEWLGKIYGLSDIKTVIGEGLITDQGNFYQAFLKDILEAEKEVIIDSPFVTMNRVEQMVPIIKMAIDKGVKVFVLTRISEDQQSFMKNQSIEALSLLEKMGVIVLPFKGFPHRKLAIIDRKILWNGSLNILSQRDSQEMMIRTEGAGTCDQILGFIRFDKNIGKTAGEDHLEHCEFCNKVGSWYWTDYGMFGLWTYCLTGGHKKGKLPKTEEELKKKKEVIQEKRKSVKERTPEGVPICPDHQIPMVIKKGRYGEFWGCPKYPRCKIVDKVQKKNSQGPKTASLFEM
jgi:superfamily I DNA and/or RNA helicase/ssDNA-binding Zn-finger/Zn-ribbon topoisomerase 1